MNYEHKQELQYSLFSQHRGLLNMTTEQQQPLMHLLHESQLQRKWTYILADHLKLTACPQYCIAMQKPVNSLLVSWVEKIITAGQAALIIVENMQLDEVSHKRLAMLCLEQGVSIVNIVKQPANNLIYGPW